MLEHNLHNVRVSANSDRFIHTKCNAMCDVPSAWVWIVECEKRKIKYEKERGLCFALLASDLSQNSSLLHSSKPQHTHLPAQIEANSSVAANSDCSHPGCHWLIWNELSGAGWQLLALDRGQHHHGCIWAKPGWHSIQPRVHTLKYKTLLYLMWVQAMKLFVLSAVKLPTCGFVLYKLWVQLLEVVSIKMFVTLLDVSSSDETF